MSKRILVIDDEASLRDAFDLALSPAGYAVECAESGMKGVEAAIRQRPDMVFLDLRMPGMDGVETLRKLLAHDRSLKVCIVTAFAPEYMGGLNAARAAGLAFNLAAKPLLPKQILAIAEASIGGACS